jgi:hypothetical protein
MFLTDPFRVGRAVPLTEKQKADKALDDEWNAAGKPTLEERIADRNRCIKRELERK